MPLLAAVASRCIESLLFGATPPAVPAARGHFLTANSTWPTSVTPRPEENAASARGFGIPVRFAGFLRRFSSVLRGFCVRLLRAASGIPVRFAGFLLRFSSGLRGFCVRRLRSASCFPLPAFRFQPCAWLLPSFVQLLPCVVSVRVV